MAAGIAKKGFSWIIRLIGAVVCSALCAWLVNRLVSSIIAHPITIEDTGWSDAFVVSVTTNPFWLDPDLSTLTIGVFVLCLLFFMIGYSRSDANAEANARKGEEHGSARWAELKELLPFKAPHFEQNFIASEEVGISIPAFKNKMPYSLIPSAWFDVPLIGKLLQKLPGRISDRNKHVLVVGGSGSGKTYNIVGPNLLQAQYSFLNTDPKGDTCKKYGAFLLKMGYKVRILDIRDPSSFGHSFHYNPFKYIVNQGSIMTLVNTIINNTSGTSESKDPDDFFVKAERSLYMCLIGYLYYAYKDDPSQQTIPKMLDMINLASASERDEAAISPLDVVMDLYKEELIETYGSVEEAMKGDEWFVITQYEGFKKAAGETAKSIIISCFVRLAPFAIGSLRELFSSDELELEKVGEEKTALFLVFNDQDRTFNFILAMVLSQFFDINVRRADTSKGSHVKIPILCFLDELGSCGTITDLDTKASNLRSRWINLIPILQNTSQLDRDYGKDSARIIKGNCDTTIYLGRSDDETNEEISKRLGEETITVETKSESKKGGTTTNYNQISRRLLTADELGSSPEKFADDECLVMIKNAHPYKDKKFNLRNHPNYKLLEKAGELDLNQYVLEQRVERYRANKKAQEQLKTSQKPIEFDLDLDALNKEFMQVMSGVKEVVSL